MVDNDISAETDTPRFFGNPAPRKKPGRVAVIVGSRFGFYHALNCGTLAENECQPFDEVIVTNRTSDEKGNEVIKKIEQAIQDRKLQQTASYTPKMVTCPADLEDLCSSLNGEGNTIGLISVVVPCQSQPLYAEIAVQHAPTLFEKPFGKPEGNDRLLARLDSLQRHAKFPFALELPMAVVAEQFIPQVQEKLSQAKAIQIYWLSSKAKENALADLGPHALSFLREYRLSGIETYDAGTMAKSTFTLTDKASGRSLNGEIRVGAGGDLRVINLVISTRKNHCYSFGPYQDQALGHCEVVRYHESASVGKLMRDPALLLTGERFGNPIPNPLRQNMAALLNGNPIVGGGPGVECQRTVREEHEILERLFGYRNAQYHMVSEFKRL